MFDVMELLLIALLSVYILILIGKEIGLLADVK